MLLSLLFTAVVYCIVPICISLFCKSEMARSTYRLYCIFSAIAILVILIFVYAGFEIDGYPNITAAVIWSVIAYNIGISILRKRKMLAGSTKSANQEPEGRSEQESLQDASKKFVCTECGAYSTGWYQKCPSCGAVGKMKKNDM